MWVFRGKSDMQAEKAFFDPQTINEFQADECLKVSCKRLETDFNLFRALYRFPSWCPFAGVSRERRRLWKVSGLE